MKLHLFGSFRIELSHQTRLLTGVNATLLGMLALNETSDHAVTRTRLAGTIWPEMDEERARRLLSNALYRLRQLLGNAARHLVVKSDNVSLRDVWVDVSHFRQLLVSPSVTNCQAAFDLYAGDLLEEQDGFWLLSARAELRELFLTNLSRTTAQLERDCKPNEALLIAHRWALADPLNETAHMTTIRLLAAHGRYGAALQQYDTLVNLLAEELDVEPLPETAVLAQTIRREREQLAVQEVKTAVPFIGRQQERAQIVAQLKKMAGGQGGIIFVEGEAGIGKTRLLEEAAATAEWRGVLTAWGRTAEFDIPHPYAPLPDALQTAVSPPHFDPINAQLTPILRDLLTPFVPQLGGNQARMPSLRPSKPAPKLPTTTAVTKLLVSLANTAPSLLIFDDVQWADAHFWEMMTAVAAATVQSPLLIILSYRGHDVRQNAIIWETLQLLDRDYTPIRLQLIGFTAAESDAYTQALTIDLPAEKRQEIQRLSHGNPLIIKELALNKEDMAASLDSLLTTRLEQLTKTAVQSLTAAAILGREFDYAVWQAMLSHSPPIALLIERRFLTETERGYAFQHDLLRAHIIQTAPPAERRRWHGRAADALLREAADAPTLAWHYEQAERFPQAIHYCRQAATRALRLKNHAAAHDFCNRALAMGDVDDSNQLQLRCLRLQIDQAETWSSANERETKIIERLARQEDDPETLLNILLVRFNHLVLQGRLDDLQELGDEALRIAQELGDRKAEIHTLNEIITKLVFTQGDIDRAIQLSRRAVTLAEAISHEPLYLASSLFMLTGSYLRARQTVDAQEPLARAEAIITAHPELASLQPDLFYYQAIAAQLGREWEKARDLQHRLVDIHRRANNDIGLGSALYNSSHIASFIGQHEEAIMFAEESVQRALANSAEADQYLIYYYRTMLFDCYTLAGDFKSAEALLPALLRWLNQEETGRGSIRGWTAVGTLRFYQGQLDAAQYAYNRAITLAKENRAVTGSLFLCHAEVSKLLGKDEEADVSFADATARIQLPASGANAVYYYYVHYLISGDGRHLDLARMTMFDLVNRLQDPQLSRDYYQQMPLHRDIERRWHDLPMERVRVQLARRDVPLGKSLTPDERIEVEWTVDAGVVETAVFQKKSKVGLRHHRLLRLTAEARAQGAAPTHADLAAALGVTTRTIERDSVKLAAAGTPLVTRRK